MADGDQAVPAIERGRIIGIVWHGPFRPNVGPDTTESDLRRPCPGATVEAVQAGRVIAATESDDAGLYQLSLEPGDYLIRARKDGLYLRRQPGQAEPGQMVTVTAGGRYSISFMLDTGMRCARHPGVLCALCREWGWRVLGHT